MASVPAKSITPAIGETITPLEVFKVIDNVIENAKKDGELKEYESTMQHVEDNGITYQIRLCPALAKKEAVRVPMENIAPHPADVQTVVETVVKHDPFTPPFGSLYIGEMKDALEEDEGGYYLLLNKFAVVRGHFLLVTKDYQSQSDPLSPSQLAQIYLLLLSAQQSQRPYFAFFNCGILSGASQPHKHIQFIPGEPPIENLARVRQVENEARPFVIPELPFSTHIKRLDRSIIQDARQLVQTSSLAQDHRVLERLSAELSMAFMSLLDEMYHSIRVEHSRLQDAAIDDPDHAHNNPHAATTIDGSGQRTIEPSTPSYNILLTLEHIYLFPRVSEKFILASAPTIPPTPVEVLSKEKTTPTSSGALAPLEESLVSTGSKEEGSSSGTKDFLPPAQPDAVSNLSIPHQPLLPASPSTDAPPAPDLSKQQPTNPDGSIVESHVPSDETSNPTPLEKGNETPWLDLSINTLGFAGCFLVKSAEEFERVKEVGVGRILKGVGRVPLKEGEDRRDEVLVDL